MKIIQYNNKVYLLILLSFLIVQTKAQKEQVVINKLTEAGGENTDIVKDICIDSESNIYITGEFNGNSEFSGKKIKNENIRSIFIAKYSEKGKYQKIITIGSDKCAVSSIACDNDDNLYICGDFRGNLYLENKEIKSLNFKDNFIVKYDNKGKLSWIKHIEADTKNNKTFIEISNDGKIYYAGSFYKTIKLDNIVLKSESSSDIFVSELNKEGEFISAVRIGGFDTEELKDIKISDKGDIFLTGSFKKEIVFGQEKYQSKGRTDIFTAKLSNMNPVWLKQAGGAYNDYGKEIVIKNNRIYTAGNFSGKAEFENIQLESQGNLDIYTAVYDFDGNLINAASKGGKANDYLHSLAVTPNGNVYLTGNFRGNITLNEKTVESNTFRSDVFMIKYNSELKPVWINNYGGEDSDFPVFMITDKDNYIYQTGNFKKIFKADEFETKSENADDIYIAKFYDCENSVPLTLENDTALCADEYEIKTNKDFEEYLWNNGSKKNEIYINKSGQYSLSVKDKFGCIFSDTINITLYPPAKLNLPEEVYFETGTLAKLDAGEGFSIYEWSNGEKTQVIFTEEEGVYEIKAENEYACRDSAEIYVSEKHIAVNTTKEENKANVENINTQSVSVEVYPNPSKGVFKIKTSNFSSDKIRTEIHSANGSLIQTKEFNGKSILEIDISKQAPGTYFLKIYDNETVLSKELVIEK